MNWCQDSQPSFSTQIDGSSVWLILNGNFSRESLTMEPLSVIQVLTTLGFYAGEEIEISIKNAKASKNIMIGTSGQGFDLMDNDRDLEEETSNELETVEECDDTSGDNKMVELSAEELVSAGSSEPYVGMEFKSADDAREYYSEYARLNGFTIRVNRKRRSRIDRAVIGFDYVCSKEGFRRKKFLKEEKIIRLSRQTRVGCKAILVIAFRRDIEKWVVTNFIREHNHELMVPSEVPVRQSDKGPLNEDEKDKRIRELTTKLYNEKQRFQRQCAAYEERCAAYKIQLGKIMKDIDIHTEHLTRTVQDVVQNIKQIEDEESDHWEAEGIQKGDDQGMIYNED
ncbi:FAR1 DNA binding domain [Macleaya cordata]|uniref:FAR1 DNA binding domain n=1 Tax=Macleaya cordata TaxID=56857 RepID=A0A200Q295_MACCD|nr:FAR1 DNA binding domain [Macleaya cordata]